MPNSNSTNPEILIIGGGISGLSAACYAQMNGFSARVLEMSDKPGGCCTSWDRRGYIFDPCISWLNGSGNDSNDELSAVWRELNTFDGKVINQVNVFNTVKFPTGEEIKFYCDPDKLETYLTAISPDDEALIKQYCNYVRDFRKCSRYMPFLKAKGLRNFWDKALLIWRIFPYMRTFSQTMSTSVSEFAARFKHPLLKDAFRYILFDAVNGLPLLPSCYNVANAADNNAGVPAEGSLSVAKSLEKRLGELGGRISYKTRVDQILVENNCTQGVRLSNGEVLNADIVIGASDGHNQIYNMLGGQYRSEAIDKAYACFETTPEHVFPGTVCMFIGVNADYTHLPAFATYILDEQEQGRLPGLGDTGISVQIRNKLYPSSAPAGKSVIYISFLTDFNYWNDLNQGADDASRGRHDNDNRHTRRKRSVAYRQTKNRLIQEILDVLENRHPGLRDKVEYTDLATPLTCLRFTGNHNGSIFGWTPMTGTDDDIENEIARLGGKLPNLTGFYMAGHWLGNGGVTRAAHSGRHVMQYICKDYKKPFIVKPKETQQGALISCLT
ncbi:MAG: NAD(P)/FAD-dependent oxidoreductase [Gammaproteobacteria bacterium]|nr:NAD(P)/FAD-dependent oxidoreductase [Gammaproteobacteria bacterium]